MALRQTPVVAFPQRQAQINTVGELLRQAGLAPLQTADQIEPPTMNKLQVAQAAKALTDWQDKILFLDATDPADWDAHIQLLAKIPGLTRDNHKALFIPMKEEALKVGIGYDSKTRKFYKI